MSEHVIEIVLNNDAIAAGFFAWCEGCDSRHYIPVVPLDGKPVWQWNGDGVKPTFSPSILIYEYEGHHPRCHSFIRDGVWEYLSDCTHALAGLTRPLKAISEWGEDAFTRSTEDD